MIKVMSEEVARFIQSRFKEFRINEALYENLLVKQTKYTPRIYSFNEGDKVKLTVVSDLHYSSVNLENYAMKNILVFLP